MGSMPRLGGVVCTAILLTVAVAHADDKLERAKAALDASDYAAARSALDEALASGTNGPDQLAEAYRLSGIVRAALGDAKAAQEAFTRCLALTPKATLPVGTSPKIAKPFAAAQNYWKTREPLGLKTETTGASPPTVTVIIASDPLSMIAKLRVYAVADDGAEKTIDHAALPRAVIELPVGERIDLRVAALDDKGNRLVEVGSKEVPIVVVGPKSTKPKPKPQQVPVPVRSGPVAKRPLYLQWWLWGGVAVVFGGAGVYFGIDAVLKKGELDDLNANSPNHTFDEALAVEKRARRSVLFANIGLISGGAFAAGAAVLWLIRPRERPTERRLSVTPVVRSNGGGIVLGGHF